jgi:uncharacterized protein (TIGR02466 family)
MESHTFYSFSIKHFQDKNLAGQLLPITRKFLSDPSLLTNEWNYKNTYTIGEGLSTEPELKFFVDLILDNSKKFLDEQGIKIKSGYKLWVSMFASEMKMGDQHESHNHPGALLSGIFYLQVPPGSSKIEFYSPRNTNKAWKNFLDESSYELKSELFRVRPDHIIQIEPKDGLFLLWESWAHHKVPVNQSLDGRITLVFNVGVDNNG